MEKEFVPYGLALRMKHLGFDEPCLAVFNQEEDLYICHSDSFESEDTFYSQQAIEEIGYKCLAPTFSQAFRWFREKYHLYGKVETTSLTCHFIMIKEVTLKGTLRENPKYVTYNSYEEAELDCLIKLIEIVESKIK